MYLKVLVKTNKKQNHVYWQNDGLFPDDEKVLIVETNEPPIDGRANKKIIILLADFFEVNKSLVGIKSGHSSRSKLIEIVGLAKAPN